MATVTKLSTPISALDKMLALNLNISLWSARKKITFEDVDHISSQGLPSQDLAALGSKKIAPPESLRIFTTLKARAVNMLDRYGVRFMSGWAIPENLAHEVMSELCKIRDEFNGEKEKLLNGYDDLVTDWISKHNQWKEMLTQATDSPEYVRSRMTFDWQLYRVKSSFPKPSKQQQSIETGLNQAVENLGETLFDDIAKTAGETWRKVYEGKDSVSHKALSPLKTLEQKLKGLSFIEPRVFPVAQIIEESLARVPKRGNIIGGDLVALQGLVCLMRDKKTLVSHAQKLMDGQSMDSLLDNLLGVNVDDNLAMAAYVDVDDFNNEATVTDEQEANNNSIPIITDSLGLW